MAFTKKEILKRIYTCAKLYKENFSGCNLLFVYLENGTINTLETAFSASNFRHLTGVITSPCMRAKEFFDKAVKKRLNENGITDLKLSVLPEFLGGLASSAKMTGEHDNNSKIELETEILVGNVTRCMGFTLNDGNIFVPNTILAEDIRDIVISINNYTCSVEKKTKY